MYVEQVYVRISRTEIYEKCEAERDWVTSFSVQCFLFTT